MKFPVSHFKFPGDNVPASPAKVTACLWLDSIKMKVEPLGSARLEKYQT